MTSPADADAEMREALFDILADHLNQTDDGTVTGKADGIAAILVELRRRGAWLPGDPVTDGMVEAGFAAYIDANRIGDMRSGIRDVITAALAANAKARTE